MNKRALISVSDKTGVVPLVRDLAGLGFDILSTGGTAKVINESGGVPVIDVAAVTGFPAMLDDRVKTLHPAVHGGLLARRDLPSHMTQLAEQGFQTIDVLVVNFYPFEKTIEKPGCSLEEAIENIDIGGPAMVRSAAKNWRDVAVVTDPSQYGQLVSELDSGELSLETKFKLAFTAFRKVADYDVAIADYLGGVDIGKVVFARAVAGPLGH